MSQTLEEILQLIFPIGRPPDRKVSTLWGSFSIWDFSFFGRQYWIKTLEVNPQKRLSLQRHHFRSEFWIPASGEGVALIDGHKFAFQGQSEDGFYVRPKIWHRLINTSSYQPLIVIEYAWGKVLSEEDIERKEDDFGRV